MPDFKQPFVRMMVEDEEDRDLLAWRQQYASCVRACVTGSTGKYSMPKEYRAATKWWLLAMNNVLQVTSQKGLERFSSPSSFIPSGLNLSAS